MTHSADPTKTIIHGEDQPANSQNGSAATNEPDGSVQFQATHTSISENEIARIGESEAYPIDPGDAHADPLTVQTWEGSWQPMVDDLRRGVKQYWFWMALSWLEIVQRYRGSVIGPFWLTLTTLIFILGLGPLYATLFGLEMRAYLPFMGIGIIMWNYLLACFNESCRSFIDAGPVIKQINLPKSTYIFNVVYRNLLIFLHNAVIIFALAVYAAPTPSLTMLLAIPGLALVAYNMFWCGLILAIICARFRDVVQIVSSVLLLGFFLTPIMWNPSLQRVPEWFVLLNPLAGYIDLVRAPLLGLPVTLVLITKGLLISSVVSLSGMWFFQRYRRYIVYWV